MKELAFCWLLLAVPLFAYSQHHALRVNAAPVHFDSAAKVVLQELIDEDPNDTSEGGDVNAFRRWTEFYKNRIAYDAPADSSIHEPLSKGLSYYMTNTGTYCGSSGGAYSGNWIPLGPFNNYYGPGQYERQGRIDAIWVDPNDNTHILAGAHQGGLWKTTDQGVTWTNISDPTGTNNSPVPGTMGVMQIAVNPLDHRIIYVAMNMENVDNKHGGYAMGLAYTTDGGQTWNYDYDFLTANAQNSLDYSSKYVRKMAYMPGTDDLYVISENKVLIKQSQSLSWFDLTPASSLTFSDLEFSIATPGKAIVSSFAAGVPSMTKFWVFTTSSFTWASLSITVPSGFVFLGSRAGIMDFSVNASDTLYYFLKCHTVGTPAVLSTQIWKTPLSTTSPQVVNSTYPWDRAQYLVVSPTNSRIIYATQHNGYTSFFRSTDWGQNFSSIAGSTHADARAITLYHADSDITGDGDILVGGSDGGVVMKRSGKSEFESITGDGLNITQFYSMSNSEADEDIMTGGAQDNGIFSYVKTRGTPWVQEAGSDGFNTKFANNGLKQSFVQWWPKWLSGALHKITFSGNASNRTVTDPPNELSLNFLRPMTLTQTTFAISVRTPCGAAPPPQMAHGPRLSVQTPKKHLSATL